MSRPSGTTRRRARPGGPASAATLRVSMPAQRVTVRDTPTRQDLPHVLIRLRSSANGLAAVRIRAGRRLIGRETVPLWQAGRQTVRVLLTRSGLRHLRRHHPLRLRATAHVRDVVGQDAAARSRPRQVRLGRVQCARC
jgi:hypothetical protein